MLPPSYGVQCKVSMGALDLHSTTKQIRYTYVINTHLHHYFEAVTLCFQVVFSQITWFGERTTRNCDDFSLV